MQEFSWETILSPPKQAFILYNEPPPVVVGVSTKTFQCREGSMPASWVGKYAPARGNVKGWAHLFAALHHALLQSGVSSCRRTTVANETNVDCRWDERAIYVEAWALVRIIIEGSGGQMNRLFLKFLLLAMPWFAQP
jgi:hypothetical protein